MKWTLEFVSTPTNWQVLHLKLSESSYSLGFFCLKISYSTQYSTVIKSAGTVVLALTTFLIVTSCSHSYGFQATV